MVYHISQHCGLNWLPGAWVSVDLFFVLSGFVIAFNYSDKILNGMSFVRFFIIRLIRLWPLYIVGLFLGLMFSLFDFYVNKNIEFNILNIVKYFLLGVFWMPTLQENAIFPLNNPAWSLFFEMFVNLLFVIYLQFFKKLPGFKILFVFFILYCFLSFIFRKINPGWSGQNFFMGFPRVLFFFFFGVYIYTSGLFEKKFNFLIILFFIISSIFIFFQSSHEIAFLGSIFLIPATVVFACTVKIDNFFLKFFKILGDLSYPIYVIHFPVMIFLLNMEFVKNTNSIYQLLFVSGFCVMISFFMIDFDLKIRRNIMKYFV